MKIFKTIIYLILTLAVIFYAIPRVPLFDSSSLAKAFSIVWFFFALLILGAHLDHLLGLDEEKRIRLAHLEKVRLWRKEQHLLQSSKRHYEKA
ncbi:MAG: hypothetical protein ACH0QD_03335 [Tepidibacillus sp.]